MTRLATTHPTANRAADAVDAAEAAFLGRLDPQEAEALRPALRVLRRATDAEELAREGAEAFFAAARSLWRFAANRPAGAPRVRLYHPEPERDGWRAERTVLEVVNDDMPFLLDSVSTLVAGQGVEIDAAQHPILTVRRDQNGVLLGVADADDPAGLSAEGAVRESWIQLQMERVGDPEILELLARGVETTLSDVRAAVADYGAMRDRLADCADELRRNTPATLRESALEAAEFLDWMADGHFTLLACRDYALASAADGRFQATPGDGLGLMRDPAFTVLRDPQGRYADWSPEMEAFVAEEEPLTVLKANRRSTVRRPAHFDLVGVKRFDASGAVIGQHAFVGLLTAAAYTRSPADIPMLRGKTRRILERAGFPQNSHDGIALAHLLSIHPRDELFQASEDELYAQAIGALRLATQPRTRLFVRPDRFGRFLSCLVYVNRERYDTAIRKRIAEILCEAVDGRVADFTPAFGVDGLIRVHFVIALRPYGEAEPSKRAFDVAAIERRIAEAVRDWSDALREALGERFGAERAAALLHRYGEGFSAGYRETTPPAEAAADVARLDSLSAEATAAVSFHRSTADAAEAVRVKLYRRGAAAPLSDVMPILENLGLRILEERPSRIQPRRADEAEQPLFIHDFLTETDPGAAVALEQRRGLLEEGFLAVWSGEVEDDRLNRLMLTAGLSARRTALLRAYSRFLRQAGISYSVAYMEDALIENPGVASALSRLFEALFDPLAGGDAAAREARAERIDAEIDTLLEDVSRLDFDVILRRMRNAMRATLRTNFFQPASDGAAKPYYALKFDSAALDALPAPRPWREIFVYSPGVEGAHLRGGPIARGGLRWSDRREDFRTEVLGLVKAQQVKNAVIVPVGSKGGFLPKQLPAGGARQDVQAAAIEAYKTFLRGLLDVTDNLVEGAPLAPPSVVRRDADDPYLVVAADKGTASFSDIANGVAEEYGFWLGDAFASGGGEGYDHKAMGITARGAWEAVKRHFRELGRDVQSEPFTVIGVGDMSGDVFGNGMLLSRQIRLLAAFDHRDVFIDPDPNAAASFAERQRLFDKPRSSWADYDRSLISRGGGVFSRELKAIPLTPEIQALAGLKSATATPAELIKALLGAPADLLWFGGIGTYVKAEEESQEAAGDRANDALRVDAGVLGARVVGEGANLGVTQRARIALAARGVKINTDAVDNAGGVDCSDHEVNIKIALGAATASGRLDGPARSALLKEMTDEVAALVLASNYAQTGAISLEASRAAARLDAHRRFIRMEEAAGRLDRVVEALPDEEALAERAESGLTRPEIAVLGAYAKTGLQEALIDSDLPDDPYLEHWLFSYFPTPMRERFGEEIRGHRLRREIVSTLVANAFVNEGGPGFACRLAEETGAAPAEAARAFLIARELFDFGGLGLEIDALDNRVAASAQIAMRASVQDALASQCLGLLQRGELGDIDGALRRFGPGVLEVAYAVGGLLSDFSLGRQAEREAALTAAGAPEALATRVASLEFLGGAVDVVATAERLDRGVIETAATYFAAGARLGLDWLRSGARQIAPRDDWERIAIGRLIADLRAQQSAIAASALRVGAPGCCGAACVDAWARAHPALVSRADRVFTELRADGALSVAKLAVASSQLRGWE